MDLIEQLKEQGLSAHAYLVRAPVTETCGTLKVSFQDGHFGTVPLADCYVREYEALSVDDAREISSFAYFKPVGERKFVVIGARSMNTEAQNALLKIVEEGSGRTVFFFIVEQGAPVLPTLESRCVVIKQQAGGAAQESGEAFLKMGYKDRLALAEKFTKDHDREGARQLVRSLLALAGKSGNARFSGTQLRDLLEADQYLKLSGSSPKGVIGHLALVL